MQWASPPGRTIVGGIGAGLCAIVGGTGAWVLSMTMIVGASFVAAGKAGGEAGEALATGVGAVRVDAARLELALGGELLARRTDRVAGARVVAGVGYDW